MFCRKRIKSGQEYKYDRLLGGDLFIAGVWRRENGDLDKDDVSKDDEKWNDSRCILKLESKGRRSYW